MSTTTIYPCNDSGSQEEYGPTFPASAGQSTLAPLREAGINFAKPKTVPKKFIKKAEGSASTKSARVKTSAKPKNLRPSKKKKKVGAFGEAYDPPAGNTAKGVRVAESIRTFGESFREGGPGSGPQQRHNQLASDIRSAQVKVGNMPSGHPRTEHYKKEIKKAEDQHRMAGIALKNKRYDDAGVYHELTQNHLHNTMD